MNPLDVFEFILVLVTVIVSLGIAELLGGVVRVLRHELKPGHLHWLWVLLVFNMQIQWLWFICLLLAERRRSPGQG